VFSCAESPPCFQFTASAAQRKGQFAGEGLLARGSPWII